MAQASYRGLDEFGVPLVGPEDPDFPALVRDIQSRREPFPWWPSGDLDRAAVLLNRSGKAIIVLSYLWEYTTSQGKRTARSANLGSSRQLDVLIGREQPGRDPGHFILPGSKRLITERGMFGNNLDVLPPQEGPHGGFIGGGGGGFPAREREEIAAAELRLDLVIFEDGLCAGPDESELFESITEDLEQQRYAAREIVAALRDGAPEGRIFEILRPLARRHRASPGPEWHPMPSQLLHMFANMGIHQLIDATRPQLLEWFERAAEASPVRLHRPE
jgi:hypothetical protein